MRLIPRTIKQAVNLYAHQMGLKCEFNTRNKIMMQLQNLIDGGATIEELNRLVKAMTTSSLEDENKDGTEGAITA